MATFIIRDELGNVKIDLTSSLTKISGSIITTPNESGSIVIHNPNNDRVWYHVSFAESWDLNRRIMPLTVVVNGNVLSWNAHVLANNIIYGTY
ncbi:hypothetical protein Pcaca04_23950 [Pectobacterium carotovorum subsp. carotovorum]|nr:hypothetical protein Pcaca04_23950 [Pectobacterium carotovorum subsp. carotovorum]